MKNTSEEQIQNLTDILSRLQIPQNNIDQEIRNVEAQLRVLSNTPASIDSSHVGRGCNVLNSRPKQPTKGTIVGFTRGRNPFVKVKNRGYQEIRRLPKKLELLPEEQSIQEQ